MKRTVLQCLGLGLAATLVTGSSGVLAPVVATFAAGVAGNLATDIFKNIDRAIAERFLDGWRSIDENHVVARGLRLAQVTALRAVLAKFDRSRDTDRDLARQQEGDRVSRVIRSFLDRETAVAQGAVHFGGPASEQEADLRREVVRALPDLFDASLAVRRSGDESTLVRPRAMVEAAVLGEISRQVFLEGESFPAAFLSIFEGRSDGEGWFDLFVRDAAAKVRDGEALERIWNAEQIALITALLRAQAEVLGRIDHTTTAIAKSQSRSEALIETAAGQIGDIWHGLVGKVDLQTGYYAIDADHLRRLPTLLLLAEHGALPYDDSRGLKNGLLTWATEGTGVRGRLYAAVGGSGKTRLALEAVQELRAAGWSGGLLPRSAFETRDAHGRPDAEARLERLLRADASGVILVIDYAEHRTDHVEALADVALRADLGKPIRLILLARSAAGWWDHLADNSRDVARVFDIMTMPQTAYDMPAEGHAAFFEDAKASFARMLEAVQAAEEPLVAPDWRDRQLPAFTRVTESATPLALSIEAYLAARGVETRATPLDEMVREERRHWRRALVREPRRQDGRLDSQLALMHRLVTALTLVGEVGDARPGADVHLDAVMGVTLRAGPPLPGDDVERVVLLQPVRRAVESLYGYRIRNQRVYRGAQPDVLGEHLCGSLRGLPGLAKGLVSALPSSLSTTLEVLDRSSRSVHGTTHAAKSAEALRAVLEANVAVSPADVVKTALGSSGALIPSLQLVIADLSDDQVDALEAAFPSWSGRMTPVMALIAERRAARPYGKTVLELSEGVVKQVSAQELAGATRRLIIAALRCIDDGRPRDGLQSAESAVTQARWLLEVDPRPGARDLVDSLRVLGVARAASGDLKEGEMALLEALEIGEPLNREYRDDELLFDLSSVCHNLAKAKHERGRRKSAIYFGRKSVNMRRALLERAPEKYTDHYINSLTNLLVFIGDKRGLEPFREDLRLAMGLMRRLYEKEPLRYGESLVHLALTTGARFMELKDWNEACAILEEGRGVADSFVRLDVGRFNGDYLGLYHCHARALDGAGRAREAFTVLDKAIRFILQYQAQVNPSALNFFFSALIELMERQPALGDIDRQLAHYGARRA